MGEPLEQAWLGEDFGEQFFDFAVGAGLRVAYAVKRLDGRPEEAPHEWAILLHIIGDQHGSAWHEQAFDGFQDCLLLAQGAVSLVSESDTASRVRGSSPHAKPDAPPQRRRCDGALRDVGVLGGAAELAELAVGGGKQSLAELIAKAEACNASTNAGA